MQGYSDQPDSDQQLEATRLATTFDFYGVAFDKTSTALPDNFAIVTNCGTEIILTGYCVHDNVAYTAGVTTSALNDKGEFNLQNNCLPASLYCVQASDDSPGLIPTTASYFSRLQLVLCNLHIVPNINILNAPDSQGSSDGTIMFNKTYNISY